MTQSIKVTSPAKLNLFLHVVGKRDNGYHELETLFQFLSFTDSITFTIDSNKNNQIERIDQHAYDIPTDDLIVQAARSLQRFSPHALPNVRIILEKNIPPGSGLGGGSSNAATTLLTLNKLWKLGLSQQQLLEIAVTLGADVPIFVLGKTCIATGIGDKLQPVNIAESAIVLCLPPVHAGTASVFENLVLWRRPVQNSDNLLSCKENDLEASACELYPQIGQALNILRNIGDARMSGTGAAVFLRCQDLLQAQKIAQECYQIKPEFTWIACQTKNQSPCEFV